MSSKFFPLFLLVVTVCGLALVPLLLLQPNLQPDPSPFRRPIVGAVFSVLCIVGVVAVFYPGKCRMIFKKPIVSSNSTESSSTVQFKGHHPNCEKFSGNRITLGGSVFCAACGGLLVGAIVALGGAALFSLGFLTLDIGSLWILVVGETMILVGLAQIKMSGYVKIIVNALFVVGSLISLVVVDSVGQSILVDAYVLGLIVFMLLFRILLSEWNNKRTCVECGHCI